MWWSDQPLSALCVAQLTVRSQPSSVRSYRARVERGEFAPRPVTRTTCSVVAGIRASILGPTPGSWRAAASADISDEGEGEAEDEEAGVGADVWSVAASAPPPHPVRRTDAATSATEGIR